MGKESIQDRFGNTIYIVTTEYQNFFQQVCVMLDILIRNSYTKK